MTRATTTACGRMSAVGTKNRGHLPDLTRMGEIEEVAPWCAERKSLGRGTDVSAGTAGLLQGGDLRPQQGERLRGDSGPAEGFGADGFDRGEDDGDDEPDC